VPNNWTVTSQSSSSDEQELLTSLDSVIAAQGEQVSLDKQSYVRRIQLAERVIYVKCYLKLQPGLKSYFAPSRVKHEWQNLFLFNKLDIRTPEILAYGEHRTLTTFFGGALVTAAVEDSFDLKYLSINRPDLFANRDWVNKVFDQVIDFTRRLHNYCFAHNDLNWRNILVVPDTAEVFFFDCPRGRRWLPQLMKFRALKDIAHLDKLAPDCLSQTQRLRFYMKYAQISQLDGTHKKHVRWILGRNALRIKKKNIQYGRANGE